MLENLRGEKSISLQKVWYIKSMLKTSNMNSMLKTSKERRINQDFGVRTWVNENAIMEFCLADSFVCHFRPKRVKGWNEEQEFELRNLYDRFKNTEGKKRI